MNRKVNVTRRTADITIGVPGVGLRIYRFSRNGDRVTAEEVGRSERHTYPAAELRRLADQGLRGKEYENRELRLSVVRTSLRFAGTSWSHHEGELRRLLTFMHNFCRD